MSIQSEKLMTLAGGEALYNDLRNRVDDRAPIIVDSKSGNPVAISDGVPGLKLYDMKVSFSPKQEGSGDPSPTNIRPIVGWGGIQIVNGGENVLPFGDVYEEGWTDTVDGLTASYSNGVFSITGNHTVSGWTNFTKETVWNSNPIILPPGTYTPANQLCIRCSIDGGEFANKSTTFTAKTNVVVRGFYIAVQGEGEKSLSVPLIMSPGSTRPTEYVPYRETVVYPVSWQTEAGTVYGGTLDAMTGVLTVTHKRVKVSDFTWTYNTNGVMRMASNTPSDMLRDGLVISDNYKTVPKVGNWSSFQTVDDYSIAQYAPSDNLCIVIKDSRYTVPKTFVSEQGNVEIVYELAEPYVVQLNSVQIVLLAGTNTIWTDANNMQIAYPVDTKKYIDAGASDVKDVQIKGTSILQDGVANIPISGIGRLGVVRTEGLGLTVNQNSGEIMVLKASDAQIKAGTSSYVPIVPGSQHVSAFYALAKLAGADLASQTVTLGQYPDAAKIAIQHMFGVEDAVTFVEAVSGSTPTIIGVPNVKYECGELTSLTLTAPASGTIDVWFMTGNTPTMLTTTGVIFPAWFDPTDLEANTVYELVITDGYGGVSTWERPVTV